MKHWKYAFFVLLSGSCAGVFFYVRSFPVVRFYTDTGVDSSILWAFPTLLEFGKHVLITTLILFVIWLLYSLIYSRFSVKNFEESLHSDAYTYLPLCLLGIISIFQFNTLLVHYFEGFLMLAQSFGYIVLFAVLLAVLYLKIENIPQLRSALHDKTPSAFSDSPPTRRMKLLVFVFSFVLYVLIGFRITDQLIPSGDEPHYLLVAHSILYDHDLKIDNNYAERHYQSFLKAELDSHVSLAKDGTVYSVHLPGLPLLILPGYMFYGWQGAVICINFLAALLAVQLYLLAFSMTQNTRLSIVLWFVISFTSPLLILSSQVYPAIPTALCAITAYRISHSRRSNNKVVQSLLLGGVLAFIPWQNQRVALLAVLLFIYHLAISWIRLKEQKIGIKERRISFLKFFMCQPSVFLPLLEVAHS